MDEETSGVVEQEAAAPATEEVTSEQGEASGAADQTEEAIPNEVWAAARKRAEKEAQTKIAKQMADRDSQYAQRFGQYKNPVTGKPIQSEADYFAALDAQKSLQVANELKGKGIDPAMIDEAVKRNPLVQAAGQVLERVNRDEGNRMFETQFAEIQKIDPRITDVQALQSVDTFSEFDRMVRSGMDMVSAYKLANFDYLSTQKAQSAQQAAINSARGKKHLAPASGGAEGTSDLTDEDLDMWEKLGFSKADAIKAHNKFKKER